MDEAIVRGLAVYRLEDLGAAQDLKINGIQLEGFCPELPRVVLQAQLHQLHRDAALNCRIGAHFELELPLDEGLESCAAEGLCIEGGGHQLRFDRLELFDMLEHLVMVCVAVVPVGGVHVSEALDALGAFVGNCTLIDHHV